MGGGTSKYAGLVPAAMHNLTPDRVEEKFTQYKIDVLKFGKGEAKTFEEVAKELAMGEWDLMEEDGALVREVQVVVLRLVEPSGKVLVQVGMERTHNDGHKEKKDDLRLPGMKQRPHENPFQTARRVVTSMLGFEDELVSFDVKNSFLIEEVRNSPVYPGMLTVYRKNVVDAKIVLKH